MPVCRYCGVEIDEGPDRCPLCRTPLGHTVEEKEEAAGPGDSGNREEGSRPLSRFRLWEIVSLFTGTSAAVVLLADFALSTTVTWARYPLVAIAFLWSVGSLLLLLRRRILLLVAETATLAIFLQVLDLFVPGQPWFLTLALPVTVLAGILVGGISAVVRVLRRRVLAILAVILAGAGVSVVGLEAAVSFHYSGAIHLSWSLLVLACAVPLVGLLLYVQYRLKASRDDLRKIFHA